MPEIRYDLTNLDAADGFLIIGDTAGDNAGIDVSSAGDINGDGIEDFIVGAFNGDDGGTGAGEAYVIFGRAGMTRANIDLTTLAAADGFIIQGDTAGDGLGGAVSNAGDINGDGIDDLIIGATGGDNGGSNAGEAYVIFGKAGMTRANIDLTNFSADDGFIIQGDLAVDLLGSDVSAAGDVNGDSIDDLIVGARQGGVPGNYSGTAYVIFGQAGATRANIDTSALAPTDGYTISGDINGDNFGNSVSNVGDINGDGIDDLIVGAPSGDNSAANAGEAYVIFGKAGATRANLDVTALAAEDGFIIAGAIASDALGQSVSNAGDVNNDGIDDLLIGAPNLGTSTTFGGTAYVVYGTSGATRANINLASLTATDGFAISAVGVGDVLGFSVAAGGDINGDGIDDIVVGAQFNDVGGANSGAVYVIFGTGNATRANIGLATLDGTVGVVIQGDVAADRAGYALSSGDFNNDGFSDVLIGAPTSGPGGAASGATYVIWGRAQFTNTINGTGSAETLNGTAAADVIRGLDGNDVLNGGAGADRMEGGIGNDIYLVDDAGDTTVENASEGIDSVETTLAAYTLAANVENMEFIGAGAFNGTGNELANIIVGGASGDTLSGLDGDDTLGGEAGDDILNGGNGADRLNGGVGADIMNGDDGNDRLTVDNAGDVANGGSGIDTVQVAAGGLTGYIFAADIEIVSNVSGGSLEAVLNDLGNTYSGSAAVDDIQLGGGGDTARGRAGADTFDGGTGNDYLYGDEGNDTLFGGADNDFLYGGADQDTLFGGNGRDTLYGESGDDTLHGGGSADFFYGGAGNDSFQFDAGDTGSTVATADRIMDFAAGDLIDLSFIDGVAGSADSGFNFVGTAAFSGTAGELRYQQVGAETYIYGDTNGDGVTDLLIRVQGTHAFSAGDFAL